MIRQPAYVPKDFSPSRSNEKTINGKNNAEISDRKITAQNSDDIPLKEEAKKNVAEEAANIVEIGESRKEKEIAAQSVQNGEGLPFWFLLAVILLCFNK